jgi:hypothetical protein
VAADAGRSDACGCHYLLGAAIMADIVYSSSRVPGETLGSGHQTRQWWRHSVVIFLKDVVHAAYEGADDPECGVAR